MVWKTADTKIVGMATIGAPSGSAATASPKPPAAPAPQSKTVCTESEGRTRCVTTIEWVTPQVTKPTEEISTKPAKVVSPPPPKVERARREVRYTPRRAVRYTI